MAEASYAKGMRFESAQPVCSTPYLQPLVLELTASLPRGARVLDVGCGNGYWARLFQSRGCNVVGIDPSPSGIAIARQECPEGRFERMEADVDLLYRLREDPFDLVISTEVVEHLYDPPTFAS